MARIVDRELQRMENGEIDQLSDKHNSRGWLFFVSETPERKKTV